MNHIIVNFQPFTLEQSILVYVDGACVEQTKAPIEQISNMVNGLKNKYNIKQIDLCGNSEYLSRFKAELNLKFGSNDTEILIHNR